MMRNITTTPGEADRLGVVDFGRRNNTDFYCPLIPSARSIEQVKVISTVEKKWIAYQLQYNSQGDLERHSDKIRRGKHDVQTVPLMAALSLSVNSTQCSQCILIYIFC